MKRIYLTLGVMDAFQMILAAQGSGNHVTPRLARDLGLLPPALWDLVRERQRSVL